ncbi:ubiquitin-like small modifier protein 1 [Salinarchaeum sp. IM2453]|uniref:ubiquitin-like small modifier protein 1 n=1 Tax=Salinarchaeum sp. IM2453 TaxID=2862870 RepID=UPI002104FF41
MQWRLFADLRERAGTDTVEVQTNVMTVQAALDELLSQHEELETRVLDEDGNVQDHINILVNGESISDLDAQISADDELALFPPVSGG